MTDELNNAKYIIDGLCKLAWCQSAPCPQRIRAGVPCAGHSRETTVGKWTRILRVDLSAGLLPLLWQLYQPERGEETGRWGATAGGECRIDHKEIGLWDRGVGQWAEQTSVQEVSAVDEGDDSAGVSCHYLRLLPGGQQWLIWPYLLGGGSQHSQYRPVQWLRWACLYGSFWAWLHSHKIW